MTREEANQIIEQAKGLINQEFTIIIQGVGRQNATEKKVRLVEVALRILCNDNEQDCASPQGKFIDTVTEEIGYMPLEYLVS